MRKEFNPTGYSTPARAHQHPEIGDGFEVGIRVQARKVAKGKRPLTIFAQQQPCTGESAGDFNRASLIFCSWSRRCL